MAITTQALRDWIEDEGTPLERRALILEGPVGSPCAYVGVPLGHPLADRHYNDMPLDCHGGLTFGQEGRNASPRPAGWYWYGWDYCHSGDFMSFAPGLGGHHWTVEEVETETHQVMDQLRGLLAEAMND